MKRLWLPGLLSLLLIGVLNHAFVPLPALEEFLDPADGVYALLEPDWPGHLSLSSAELQAPVTILRDRRGVPHIFARNDRDATFALGYVVAHDRLFQLLFLPRVAAGRLSEWLGKDLLDTDRALRQTGMARGARHNLQAILQENGLEKEILTAFVQGANTFIRNMRPEQLPLEFRLLDVKPEPLTLLDPVLLMQYMAYTLSYGTDRPEYAKLREALGDETFERLFPLHSPWYRPIIPGNTTAGHVPSAQGMPAIPSLFTLFQQHERLLAPVAPVESASNNWAVRGRRSATGAPLLANDPHLQLTLPAIWYEVHLVTPATNIYGVTIPGAPAVVLGFNDVLGWAFTNTGADVMDFYALTLDSTGTRYRYNGTWRSLEAVPDTLFLRDGAFQVDTLLFSHWGPVLRREGTAMALQWTAHKRNRILQALWLMNRARSYTAFEQALRYWDTPMQNILYADVHDTIAIRSTGFLPIRGTGRDASGLLPGDTNTYAWTGRVPFEELPHAINPPRDYLFSANQEPTDTAYPYYLKRNWLDSYRSIRIDSLLGMSGKVHRVEDFMSYQQDVYVVQRWLFLPLLARVDGLSPSADSLRMRLLAWDGRASTEAIEPLILDTWLDRLQKITWDEPIFAETLRPRQTALAFLLREEPDHPLLDRVDTPERETSVDLIRISFNETADTLRNQLGSDFRTWAWGRHHRVVMRHLLRSPFLRVGQRGPYPFPGFFQTVLPGDSRLTRHTASWRMIVDFSRGRPRATGVYPGGASGNPFSTLYATGVEAYLNGRYFPLYRPASISEFAPDSVLSVLEIQPE